jgi:hypothetical protein
VTCIDTTSKRRLTAKLAAGFAIATVLAVGVAGGPARADWHDHRDRGWHDHHYTGGYYAAPPVVYGGPGYYAPPPVVYGPGVGISLPGINLNIR